MKFINEVVNGGKKEGGQRTSKGHEAEKSISPDFINRSLFWLALLLVNLPLISQTILQTCKPERISPTLLAGYLTISNWILKSY